MAIDNTGISSLDAGALDITYSGDEGPKSPDQQLMASADPMLVEEYQKYVFEMEEQGLQPISFREFVEQIMVESRMASGGIARLGYKDGYSVQGGVKNYLGDQETVSNVPVKWQSGPDKPDTELAYITKAEKDLILKKDLHGSLSEGPNLGPGGLMSLDSWGDVVGGMAGVDVAETGMDKGQDPTPVQTAKYRHTRSDEDQRDMLERLGKDPYDPKIDIPEEVKKEPFWDRVTSAPTDYRRKFITKRITNKRKALMDQYKLTSLQAQQIIDMLDDEEGITVDKLKALDFGSFDDMDQPHYKTGLSDLERIQRTPDLTSNPPGWLGAIQDKMIPDFNRLVSTASRIKDLEDMTKTEAFKTGKGLQSEIDAYLDTANPFRHGDPSDRGDPYIPPHLREQVAAPVVDETETETAEWEAPEIPVERLRLYSADGGRIPAAYGGIMGDDGRRRYGLGSIFKKAARGIKKVLKSPIGKAALIGLAGFGMPGTTFGGLFGRAGFGGAATGMFGHQGISASLAALKTKAMANEGKNWLGNLLLNQERTGWSPWKLGIGAASLYPLIAGTGDDDDEDFTQTDLYKRWLAQKQAADIQFAPVGDPANWQRQRLYADGGRIGYDNGGSASDRYEAKIKELMDKMNISRELAEALVLSESPGAADIIPEDRAQGGRIGYAGGYMVDDDEEDLHRTAALAAMYRRGAQEGGLMDMGGMEKDYRQEGGFVPIGGQERADDVPARLSKNEFVFTADAVRAAGGGDIDKGAEVMENVMENLEQGGQVSEESQGLEGARNMFATAQRLEGVL